MATDDDDKRVKDMLGSASMADLQRWFGLPSFRQLEEEGKAAEVPDDPYKEDRERREKALAAVEPAFLDGILARYEAAWSLLKFETTIELKVRLDMEMFDEQAVARIADPREVERPGDIEDALKDDCTPQALLRDLHRVESSFDKQYEIWDAEAQQPFAVIREVAEAMATRMRLKVDGLPGADLAAMTADATIERRLPWAELIKRNRMVNRRIKE